jgi:hypothetical protein
MALFLGTVVINKKLLQDNLVYRAQTKTSSSLKKPFLKNLIHYDYKNNSPNCLAAIFCWLQPFLRKAPSSVVHPILIELKEFTWLKKSNTGEDMAHCKLCNINFSVTAGALYDVKRHAKSSTHVTAVEASSKTKSITNFVDDKKSSSVKFIMIIKTTRQIVLWRFFVDYIRS